MMLEVVSTCVFQLDGFGLHNDLLVIFSLEIFRLHVLQDVNCPRNSRLQLLYGAFVVFHDDRLGSRNSDDCTLGYIAASLDLEGQGQHVRVESGFDELRNWNILFFSIFLSLGEDLG